MPIEVGAADTLGQVTAAVRQNPVAAVGILVAVVILAALVFWGIRLWRRSAGDRFVSALAERDAVAVLMHPNPDPDAMACAVGVAQLADEVGTAVTLQYPGQIRHQENRALETVLGLELNTIESAVDLAANDVVLVDHNEPRGFAGAGDIDPYAVVDHHPGTGRGQRFTDIRTHYGSCATIIAEYLRSRGFQTTGDGETPLPWDVATALLYGILSDTKNLTRGCSPAEFELASYLYPAADADALDRIANPSMDRETLQVKARAIKNMRDDGPFAVSDVGEISNVDALAQAAEELLRLEGITAVVVAGERDGTLHLSGRSRDDRVHIGKALGSVCDDIPMADAGGHARMGGGQLSVAHMEGIGPGGGLAREEFAARLFAAMNGEM